MRVLAALAKLSFFAAACACSPDPVITSTDSPSGAATGRPNEPIISCPKGGCANSPPGCADGLLTRDEACDDGNLQGGDGCSGNCLHVEAGFSCAQPGMACVVVARCGDGLVAPSEACDDGNAKDGDGCSSHCKLELGFKCASQPSHCVPTVCGDGQVEGSEACDDGNGLPFDGCSSHCQTEPNCTTGASCTSRCGDGLIIDEQCDDGNTRSGDGCSSSCKTEPGFACTSNNSCTMLNGQCLLRVPAIFRDFNADHSDFQVGCGNLVTGVVRPDLNPQGKPVLADGSQVCIASASSFAEWYTASATNATIALELTLYDNGKGGFVNRHGPNGEQWKGMQTFANVMYGGPGGSGCSACTPSATGSCFDPCTPWGTGNTQACCAESSETRYDGEPLFFPIDDAPNALKDTRLRAKIPEQYGYPGWPSEDTVIPSARLHNFSFTTEVEYWFEYDAKAPAQLDFMGDDDVWVFINGKLAVDLGGTHVPSSGQVTIDTTTSAKFGLQDGKVYSIRVFHAERKAEGSSFKLTLAGFNTARSDCTPICGDGMVNAGEECDDGINDGGYGQCTPGCRLGPSCGDGIVQDGEDCDDGNTLDGDGCGSACRNIILI